MKNQFDKNDKLIFHATVLADVIACVCVVIGLVYSIKTVIAGTETNNTEIILVGIAIIPLTLLGAFIIWVFTKLFINMCCDIKLIRNNLYSIDNSYLHSLITKDNKNSEIYSDDIQQVTDGEGNETTAPTQDSRFVDKIENSKH